MLSTVSLCDSFPIRLWFEDANECLQEADDHLLYSEIILRILKKILPSEFFDLKEDSKKSYKQQQQIINTMIPLITYSEERATYGYMSFFVLSHYSSHAFTFIVDMFSHWLIPGKKLDVRTVYTNDFTLSGISDEVYSICEVGIHVEDAAEQEEIKRLFSVIEREISIGIHSSFFAKRILESKESVRDVKNRIEQLHPIFKPRNEEELMRNLLTLANQLKYVRDIPQVLLTFDEQSHSHLFFTVILVRILKTESFPIAQLFQASSTCLEYIHDRIKIIGHLRKKYAKEATVFQLKLSKDNFLRSDHSIDLYKARQFIVMELCRIVGEVRDYNGGMLSKQHELLADVRRLLTMTDYNELLLENFFYSLSPVIAHTVLDPKAFKTLFLMLLEGLQEPKPEGYYLKIYKDPSNAFVMTIIEDSQIKEVIYKIVNELNIPSTELAFAHIKIGNNFCLGYVCSAHDPMKKDQLFKAIQETLQAWVLFHY